MNKNDAIEKMIAIATEEIGYLEKQSNSQLDDKTANAGYNNYTKYWRDVSPSLQAQPWCACFVSWVLMKAFGKSSAEKMLKHYPYVYCPTLAGMTSNHTPHKGDIVVFLRNGTFPHTGIVTAVNGSQISTIEGNTSGSTGIVAYGGGVCSKQYDIASLPGTRFFEIDWSIVAAEQQPEPPADQDKPSDAGEAATYTVKAGDTLWSIANRFGCSVAELAQWNGIVNQNQIMIGQILKVKKAVDIYKVGQEYQVNTFLTIKTGPGTEYPDLLYRDIPSSRRKFYRKGVKGQARVKKGNIVRCREVVRKPYGIYIKVTRGYILAQSQGEDRVNKV